MLDIKVPTPTHAFAANTYVISSNGEYAVIDPTVPYDSLGISGRVKYIFLTHGHFDHMLEIDDWVRKTSATVLIGEKDMPALADSHINCYYAFSGIDKGYHGDATPVKEGDVFRLGDEIITVMECPGHTIGSVTLLCDGKAFVGDTVFAGGGFGRCDLPTGDFSELRRSIFKILALPLDTVLYPGHGGTTKVKEYKVYR